MTKPCSSRRVIKTARCAPAVDQTPYQSSYREIWYPTTGLGYFLRHKNISPDLRLARPNQPVSQLESSLPVERWQFSTTRTLGYCAGWRRVRRAFYASQRRHQSLMQAESSSAPPRLTDAIAPQAEQRTSDVGPRGAAATWQRGAVQIKIDHKVLL